VRSAQRCCPGLEALIVTVAEHRQRADGVAADGGNVRLATRVDRDPAFGCSAPRPSPNNQNDRAVADPAKSTPWNAVPTPWNAVSAWIFPHPAIKPGKINLPSTRLRDHLAMSLTHDSNLTRQIIGLAMRVHTRLGPGMLEKVYEQCLCLELDRSELPYASQVDVPLNYDGLRLDCGFRADIIVRSEVLLALKSVEHILPVHEAQLQTYLRLSGCKVGLLLNFNTVALKDGIRRRAL